MGIFEIITISFGLAMDAFAISICKGISMKKVYIKNAIIIGIYFGLFQAIMPFIGYELGAVFSGIVQKIDHWIAFILLGTIGINMIKNSKNNEVENNNEKIDFKTMIILAIATSIDALTIGVTFAFLRVKIVEAVSIIGNITFVISMIGVFIGNKFGDKLQNKAESFGGVILILIGVKILFEHLMYIK